ncbi:MAG: hypothetical protein H7Y42_12775 [Chitinophagaceae bacterium]|nr:hypothetical protein [Chitinophagaceae bacterium]
MKPQGDSQYVWPIMFFVTAASFFIFSLLLKLIGSAQGSIDWFFRIGLVMVGLGIITVVAELKMRHD